MLGARRNKWSVEGQRIEFYDRARFIAFGSTGWQGDPETDCTEALADVVPVRSEAEDAELSPGRDPSWSGPADVQEAGHAVAAIIAGVPVDGVFVGEEARLDHLPNEQQSLGYVQLGEGGHVPRGLMKWRAVVQIAEALHGDGGYIDRREVYRIAREHLGDCPLRSAVHAIATFTCPELQAIPTKDRHSHPIQMFL